MKEGHFEAEPRNLFNCFGGSASKEGVHHWCTHGPHGYTTGVPMDLRAGSLASDEHGGLLLAPLVVP